MLMIFGQDSCNIQFFLVFSLSVTHFSNLDFMKKCVWLATDDKPLAASRPCVNPYWNSGLRPWCQEFVPLMNGSWAKTPSVNLCRMLNHKELALSIGLREWSPSREIHQTSGGSLWLRIIQYSIILLWQQARVVCYLWFRFYKWWLCFLIHIFCFNTEWKWYDEGSCSLHYGEQDRALHCYW